ncbi:MAG: 23S rRNA (uracil(1939)-C(5))-methyltransferase RlmD, partial [Candidatus Eisenbacteria bacterium]|nr:23S rRNA (uracil(1939)-C(5))-methyltransferase RlmD [Candidatus Eisenbacteria bacterium]
MLRTRQEEPVEMQIEDLAYGGEGVGRFDGQVHFVEGALPGETVRAVPQKGGGKRWRRARLLEVLAPSPERIVPACPHAAVCGGCAYQALAYPAQLEAKARQVRENLARIGGRLPPEPEPPLASPVLWHYRNKMEFSFAARPWDPAGPPPEGSGAGPGAALGLHVRGRFDAVFDLERCLLAHADASGIVDLVRRFAREAEIPGYHGGRGSGLLRHLVVRTSRASGSHLVALVVREDDPRLAPLASNTSTRT